MSSINSTSAIAIFVKTPGLSPIKTRLAKTLGQVAAENAYRLSVKSIKATVVQVPYSNKSHPSTHRNLTTSKKGLKGRVVVVVLCLV